ncbi:hypothetical protein GCM10009677_42200 [Sphaerisporangium rubeum]
MSNIEEYASFARLGFYPSTRTNGFAVHMNVCAENLSAVRKMIKEVLAVLGVDGETVESARLVASELVGNAVRACGHWAPVIVEVEVGGAGVWVRVHDPDPVRLPVRAGTSADDPEVESGRGLWLLDALTPGWDVAVTPIGKQVRCLLPREGSLPLACAAGTEGTDA